MRIVVHDYAGHPFALQLSRELARRGHNVAHMYFAGDQGPKGETGRLPDDPASFQVLPIDIGRPYSKQDFVGRWVNDRRYGIEAARAVRAFRPQVVLSGNTPLDAQSAILAATHAVGAAFVDWVQDFYSLAIAHLVGSRWGGAGRLVGNHYKRLETRIMRASDALVVITDGFRAPVRALGIDLAKVNTISNWGPVDEVIPQPKRNRWALEHGLQSEFVFLYSGTLALKHNPDRLWRLAEAFRGGPARATVVLTASGVGVDQLKARAAVSPAPNLRFLPLQPIERLSESLGAADVTVALLEPEAAQFSVPSKVLTYICAGRPILLSAPSHNPAAKLVNDLGVGLVVSPADEAAFIAAAKALFSNSGNRGNIQSISRDYAEREFRISVVCNKFEEILRRVATNGSMGGSARRPPAGPI